MIWTAWNNGKHYSSGAGYGFKIDKASRDHYFSPEWPTIYLDLPDDSDTGYSSVELNIGKPSFWNDTCREVINREIGRWLICNNFAPWSKSSPPTFEVEYISDRHFRLLKRL